MKKLPRRNFKAYTSSELLHELGNLIGNSEKNAQKWKEQIFSELDKRNAGYVKKVEDSIKAKDALLANKK